MTSTRILLLLFVSLIVCGFILSYFSDVIRVDIDRSPSNHKLSASPPFPDDKFDKLFWFIQITDLHISRFYDKERVTHLQKFCTKYLDIIKPDIVLATGDLTDAKHADMQGSEQYLEEWVAYWNVLKESNAMKKTLWLDMRGNHDAFDIPYLDHELNYFREYSSQGRQHKGSYHYIHKKPYGQYAFIAVDSCPDPGPKRPFNFFGMLNENQLANLKSLRENTVTSNTTIWMGHYPTSVIVGPQPGFREIISSGSAYLCGHLHTLGGLVPQMYTMHKHGNLELELGDWKDNRIYRVLALDHDLLSFIDVTYGEWPVILITNPKHGVYTLPHHEPTGRMLRSSSIRVLVWSDSEIEKVEISINGSPQGQAQHVQGPLYALDWNPSKFSEGVHQITVSAMDMNGKHQQVNQPFSLDNTDVGFSFIPKFVLMNNISLVLRLAFFSVWLCSILPLVLFRVFRRITVPSQYSGYLVRFIQRVLNRYHLLANSDGLYYPLIFHAVYLAIGPWFIGYALTDMIGVVFVHGVYVSGLWLPMHTTYLVGLIQLFTFNIPFTLYLGSTLERKLTTVENHVDVRRSKWTFVRRHWVFLLLVLIQSFMAIHGFYLAYGTMAFLIGPVRTWTIFFAFYLWKKVHNIKIETYAPSVSNGSLRAQGDGCK